MVKYVGKIINEKSISDEEFSKYKNKITKLENEIKKKNKEINSFKEELEKAEKRLELKEKKINELLEKESLNLTDLEWKQLSKIGGIDWLKNRLKFVSVEE